MKKLAIEGGEKSFLEGEIPFDNHKFKKQYSKDILKVLKSGRYSMFNNQTVGCFEDRIAKYLKVKKCSVLTNCTSALDASFKALDIGNGDEVIMPSYTYAATMMAILSSGAKPVFVDIDYNTLTIDPNLIKEKITNKTKAIVPVHIFGNPCDMNKIMKIAKDNDLRVIEDCAHSLGAKYGGIMSGAFDVGCHSFGENKILRIGEGGAVTSSDELFMNKVDIIRHEGEIWTRKNISASKGDKIMLNDIINGIDYVTKGHNFRYSPILAALGISKLNALKQQIDSMNLNASIYNQLLKDIPEFKIPISFPDTERVYSSYIVLVESKNFDRNTLLLSLAMEGIPVGVHFPKPLHKTKVYKSFNDNQNFPNSEKFCNNHIALPVYPNINKEKIKKICNIISYVIGELNNRPKEIKNITKKLFNITKIKNYYSGVYITV